MKRQDLKLADAMPSTYNYRKIQVEIGGEKISISGLAHPYRYNSQYIKTKKDSKEVRDETVKIIHELAKSNKTLISLDENNLDIIKQTCEELGMKHVIIPIKDFCPPKVSDLENIYKYVSEGNTAIHCGEGYGRTGTVLAAMMLMSEIYATHKSEPKKILGGGPIDKKDDKQLYVLDTRFQKVSVKCSDGVYKAIELVRKAGTTKDTYYTNGQSVETIDQVRVLHDLERKIVTDLRCKFMIKNGFFYHNKYPQSHPAAKSNKNIIPKVLGD